MHGIASPIDDRLARRNALVLGLAQALAGANAMAIIGTAAIAVSSFADKSLVTLPVTCFVIGMWAGTLPVGALSRRYGRRVAYLAGSAFGVIAGLVLMLAAIKASLVLFCVGAASGGLYGAAAQSYRFAAADTASESFKPRAISWVMVGGIAAGVIGPQSVYWTRDLTPAAPFAASFLAQGALALIAMLVVMTLRAPPVAAVRSSGGRPLGEIMRQPKFIASVIAALVAYGLMSFVMTAAPLAMVGCGHSVGDAALGIQWHVLAMFGPSFFTGRLIARFGKAQITALGLILTAAAAVVGLSGLSVAHFWTALILLGVGWNFGFIGATALVTECYRPEERVKVQAANDFLVFGSVAIASFSSGGLLSHGGWESVNWLVFPPVAVALALVAWQSFQKRAALAS